ncbi:Mitochondrial import inner membrane translocase subunit TIM17-1 [Raphanus sativus]|uniref:Mitochondrial import inner membrane translocase subunit TIM17-1-like n=1 Tax=Raphanus sativus TaxID=3726 RepID=A0A6J0KUE3_RAPSA|nr:mitochondrial import inner membrane translocase subunit TIM17-1-like [Raphanus sativus]KAJ4879555.1 Mitochondrial import inner membrane translocase subunit TIM17-1 [Raphanus sativus]
MGTPETNREPCPDRILDDIGGAFGMGVAGGSVFHFIRGIYKSPAGARLSGGAQYVRMNVPKVGGSFAVWGGLFSTMDCAMVYARQKEDPWNSIIAGAATGGLLSLRQGFRATGKAALFGGAILALIQGVQMTAEKLASAAQHNQAMMVDDAASFPPPGQVYGQSVPETSSPAASEAGSGSWFGGLFGKGKKKESEGESGSKTRVLESFDAPPVPTYEFN